MEKYLTLARDAVTTGDTVAAEGYFQHAEHYFRVMSANGHNPDSHEHRTQPQPTPVEDQPQPDVAGTDTARQK